MSARFKFQVASDVIRDGLGVELINESGEVVAEVFRCDRDHSVVVNTFSYEVSLDALEQLLAAARSRLEPFEDGLPLGEARHVEARLLKA